VNHHPEDSKLAQNRHSIHSKKVNLFIYKALQNTLHVFARFFFHSVTFLQNISLFFPPFYRLTWTFIINCLVLTENTVILLSSLLRGTDPVTPLQ